MGSLAKRGKCATKRNDKSGVVKPIHILSKSLYRVSQKITIFVNDTIFEESLLSLEFYM